MPKSSAAPVLLISDTVWERRAAEQPVDHALVKERVEELLNHLEKLSRKDLNFIESLAESFDLYGARTHISSAQQSWPHSHSPRIGSSPPTMEGCTHLWEKERL